ncbi:unnamed protein product [Mytilus edulis]|uniref:C-type lectin domain-containing protein n=1 Tax=Mytilus edulis TaxID=6550 RepID=A0A8S3TYG0_MYTED|nr:unnamed protein product [Mytilus edulis]
MEDGRMYYLKGVKNCPTEEGYTYKSSLMLCIKFYDVEVTYQNAVSTCHSENSSLVRIDSPEVQKVVYSYLTYDEKFTNSKAYIQGNRKQNTPEWEFDDETLISYMPWNLNQKQPEAYDQIFLCFNVADQGMWHDCIGTQLFRFVCERRNSKGIIRIGTDIDITIAKTPKRNYKNNSIQNATLKEKS